MQKARLNITIDFDVWLYWRQENKNISQMINNYLKGLMAVEKKNYDEVEVERNISKLKKEIAVVQQELTTEYQKLHKIKETQEEQAKDKLFEIDSQRERDYWFETADLLVTNPEFKMGRYQLYKNTFTNISLSDWDTKLEWFIKEVRS